MLKESLHCLHRRKAFVRERYGHTVAHMTHIGEGVYLFSNIIGTHEIEWFVYCGLGIVWVIHTVVIGLREE